MAAIFSSASARTLILLQFSLESINCLSARLDIFSRWKLVLIHGFHKGKDGKVHLLAGDGKNLTVLDVESEELIFHNVSLDIDLIVIRSITDVLNSFVIVASPEEGNIAERNHFAEHVES